MWIYTFISCIPTLWKVELIENTPAEKYKQNKSIKVEDRVIINNI